MGFSMTFSKSTVRLFATGPADVRVNAISPGYMDTALDRVPTLEAQKKIWTPMTAQRRLGNVDELNGLAVFLPRTPRLS